MLGENIETARKSRGLSQQELAIKLHVVRQTVSKWERGRSVPDSDLLISLSEALETPVSVLLGERIGEPEEDGLKAIAAKLEVVNAQLARQAAARRRALRVVLASLGVITAAVLIALGRWGSPYLEWDYGDPETAVVGVAFHALEWAFSRAAPIILVAVIAGVILLRRRAPSS